MKTKLVVVALFALTISAAARDLPRSAAIGLQVGPQVQDAGASKASGAMVQAVAPGGAAEKAGILAGDIVVKLDGIPIGSAAQLVSLIRTYRSGDRVNVAFLRGGREMERIAVLKPKPPETSAVADVLYRTVRVGNAERRVLVTKPKTAGKFPAVLLVGGLGCYSLDGQQPDQGYGRILTMLAEKGFVTMRVEKSGEGDSEGPACSSQEADLDLEVKGLVAGLKALKGYDFVDPSRVFVFAHSIGPIVAVKAVRQESVRGFIAAETIGQDWEKYEIENVRRQSALLGAPANELEARVNRHQSCIHKLLSEKQSTRSIVKNNPACSESFAPYAAVPDSFMQQVGDVRLADEWKDVDVPVLVIYGTSDPATSAEESRMLVKTINGLHPGKAEYVEVDGMDHAFNRAASLADGMKTDVRRDFHTGLLDAISQWLGRQS